MIYLDIDDKIFFDKIKYVFDIIFNKLGLDYQVLDKRYSPKKNDIVFIYTNRSEKNYYKSCNIRIEKSTILFGKNYLKTESIPKTTQSYCLEEFEINNIVSIYNNNACNFYAIDNNGFVINVDIISDIFFMLTRYEEVVLSDVSSEEIYQRFSSRQSMAYKNNFLHIPIVDVYIEFVWKIINNFNLGYKRKSFWGDRDFVACLTHDVDSIKKYKDFSTLMRICGKLILKNRDVKKTCNSLLNYFSGYKKDPFNTFGYIMNLEKSYGFKSSFYFMTGGDSQHDNKYNIQEQMVLELIEKMEYDGFEVGYHSSFNAYNNIEMMKSEKAKLDKIVNDKMYGCRQHFLRFKVPYTWRYQEKAGILYDTTLSFADSEGFRCGTCFPYKPYDLLSDKVLDIWEIPLIVMDGSLQNKNYNAYSLEEAIKKTKELVDVVKRYKGVFTLLWHNSSLDKYDVNWNGWEKVYTEIMKYLYDSNCLALTGKNVINNIKN